MKKLKQVLFIPLLVLLGILMTPNVSAQSSCATSAHSTSRISDYIHVPTNIYLPQLDTMNFCVKVQVYHIMSAGGNSNINTNQLSGIVGELNSRFPGSGINFESAGDVIEVKKNNLYNEDYITISNNCITADLGSFTSDYSAYSTDAIDIYVNGNFSNVAFANKIAHRTQIFLGYELRDKPVLAHEMGHVLGLFHTRHGTFGYNVDGTTNNSITNCENFDNFTDTAECPDGSNSHNSGDYVVDTQATDGEYSFCNQNNNCLGIPNNQKPPIEACGQVLPWDNVDLSNYMMANPSTCNNAEACQDTFTPYQMIRMKYFLWDSPTTPLGSIDLHDAVVNCPPEPDPCDDCNGAAGQAQAVFNTLTNLNDDCVTYQLNFPLISIDCPDRFVVTWNGVMQPLNNNGDTITQVYADEGIQTVTIKVYRGNGIKEEFCGTYDFSFVVDFDCGDPDPCDDCSTVVDSIMATLSNGITDTCERKKITIPDLGTCYSGYVSWGDGSIPDPLVSDSVMSHQYTSSGPAIIKVTLTDYNNNTVKLCSAEETVTIVCDDPCPDPCNIDADFSYANSDCSYTFIGDNAANDCDNSIYSFVWKVNGTSYPGGEVFNYDFSNEQGSNTVQLIITNSGNGQFCSNSYTETVNVNCNPNPCPSNIGIYFNNEAGGGICTTGQAGLTGQTNNVQSVNWTWALGGSNGTGASNGTTTPIYYPSGDWTGSYIAICADITFTDGSTCQALCESFLMDCGDGNSKEPNTTLYPNPTNSSFQVKNAGDVDIRSISIRDIYGLVVQQRRTNLDEEFNLIGQREGFYLVEIQFTDGTTLVKKLILKQ